MPELSHTLDKMLARLINQIERAGYPLKADEVPPTTIDKGGKKTSYTITWTGSMPQGTSTSAE